MNELEKSLLQTPDLNKERLNRLKEQFPDIFTAEGRLNFDELKKLVDPELVKESERFEFNWYGKSKAKRTAFTPSQATLVYDESRSVNPEAANGNMIIEGENLETMKCLLAAYREKVKCIYIDPPYNTGKDFVYSDKWDESKEDYWEHIGVTSNGVKVDTNIESTGRYHSNWLSMLYSRLLLSRQLLKDDGVIFISIDDNEVLHLRKLCDEIFGEDNFVGCITVVSNPRGRDYGGIARMHEYIMVYTKNVETVINDLDEPDKVFPFKDSIGEFEIRELRNRNIAFTNENRPNLYYPFYINADNEDENGFFEISLEQKRGWIELNPKQSQGFKTVWRWGKDKAFKNLNINICGKAMEDGGYQIVEKYRERTKMARSVWWDKEDNTEKGTLLLKSLFDGKKIMSFPKPVEMLRKIVEMGTSAEASNIVVDFFAGSGTIAQSVIEQNKQDSGNRKFILIQLPELTDSKSEAYKAGYKKISDITIERNKRVIEKLQDNNIGFKVYKLAKSNFPRIDFVPDPEKTEEENIQVLKKYIDDKESMFLSTVTEQNLFDEVLLKNCFMLNYKLEHVADITENKVYTAKDEFKECLICLEGVLHKETLKELEKYKEKLFICLERSLDTTMKWNLKHLLGDKLIAI